MRSGIVICLLMAVFCAVGMVFVFNRLYLPTRDKLRLAEAKITSYEQRIEEYRHAEVQTANTIKRLKSEVAQDKATHDWSVTPVPPAILNVLRSAHQSASGEH